jgi:hypothetical protein
MTPTDATEGYQLAYDESVRSLDQQERSIDALKSQAGTLVAVATLVSGFLGAEVLKRHPGGLSALEWAGLATFAASVFLATLVVTPRRWVLSNSPASIISGWVEASPSKPIDELRRDLALWNEIHGDSNGQWLSIYALLFRGAVAGLFAQTTIWLVILSRR